MSEAEKAEQRIPFSIRLFARWPDSAEGRLGLLERTADFAWYDEKPDLK